MSLGFQPVATLAKKPPHNMQTTAQTADLEDDLRPEYEEETLRGLIKGGQRGVYAERSAEGTTLVKLAPDVAAVFTTSEAVNAVLRALIQTMPQANRVEATR